ERATSAPSRSMRMSRLSSGNRAMAASRGLEDFENGARVFRPERGLGAQLLPPLGGELVVLGAAVVLGQPPLRLEPAALLHAVERGVERALLDLEPVVGGFPDPGGHGVPVARSPGEGL